MKLKNNKVMQRIGKYKYMVDAQNEADLDAINSYFIIEFECDSKIYVGWTGESQKSVKQKLYELIYYSFKKVITGYLEITQIYVKPLMTVSI